MVASNKSQQWNGNPETAGKFENHKPGGNDIRYGKRGDLEGRVARVVESQVGDEMSVKTVERLTPSAVREVITHAVSKSSEGFRGKEAERELADIEAGTDSAEFDEDGYQSKIERLIATLTKEILKVLESAKEFAVVEDAAEIDAVTRSRLGEPGDVNLYLDETSAKELRTQLENGDSPFELWREDGEAGYVLKHESDIGDGFDFKIMVLYQKHAQGEEAEGDPRTVDTDSDDDRGDSAGTQGHNSTHQGANTGPRSLAA